MKYKLNCFIILFSLIVGCHKREPVIPIPTNPCLFNACDTSKLEIIWQKPIDNDTAELGSVRPIVWGNKVLFCRGHREPNIMQLYKTVSGETIWKWSDYYVGRHAGITALTAEGVELQDNKIFFTTWDDVYSINAFTGKTVWSTKVESGEGHPRFRILNPFIYHTHLYKTKSVTEKSHLVRSNINIGKWDTVFTQTKIADFEPVIEPPSTSWINNKGEEVIFFQIRYIDFKAIGTDKPIGRVDWLAYNLTTKKEEYRFDNIDRGLIGNVLKALQYGDNIYFLCINSLFCINKNDGKIIWQKKFDINGETFSSCSPLIAENILFIKPDNRTLYALNPISGNLLWEDKVNGSGASEMIYHRGLIYYTCDGNNRIIALEPKTGKKIWDEPSPNNFKNKFNGNRTYSNANIGFGGIAIDSTLGYLYTSDFYFAMCLKLPKK